MLGKYIFFSNNGNKYLTNILLYTESTLEQNGLDLTKMGPLPC